jgi:hypothetical protein
MNFDRCDPSSCIPYTYSISHNYPTPSISGISPNSSLAGNSVAVTISGTDLGATDEGFIVYKGISSINVSGSGLTASIQQQGFVPTQPTGNQVSGVLTIDPSAGHGSYQVSLTVFGYATNTLTFTVPDQSPVITGVAELTQLQPGGQAYISIYGTNFGTCPNNLQCAGASVAVCTSGATPCNASDVTPLSISYWSNVQVNVLLNAAASALGFYDVQLTAAGPTGNTFIAAPGGQTSAQSANRGKIAVSSPSNVSLTVTTSGGANVSANSCLYIDATPAMPPVSARIIKNDGSQVAPTDTATFQITTSFPQRMRPDGHIVLQTQQTPPGSPESRAANQIWNAVFSQSLFGGQAVLQWTYNGVAQQPFSFCILGTNPDFTTAGTVLAAVPYWMAPNIAVHETNTSNFCELGRLQSAYCSSSANFGWPVWGTPGGYGIMQVDSPPSLDAIWNWRTAIAAGKTKLDSHAGPVQDTSDPKGQGTDKRAYPFWIRQVKQWQIYNSKPTFGSVIPAPPDQTEGTQGSSCTFTLSPSAAPAYTTPNTGQTGTYWFGDAILIKQYGGVASTTKNANWKPAGNTPVMVIGCPSRVMALPTTYASPLNRRSKNLCESTIEPGDSAGSKRRPSTGRQPVMAQKSPAIEATRTLPASFEAGQYCAICAAEMERMM